MKRQTEKLLLVLCCLISLTFAQSEKFFCDANNRPQNRDCFNDDSSFELMCAYYTENCPFGVCGRPSFSACEACSDPKILYYTVGECQEQPAFSTCYEGICDLEYDPQLDKVYEPVCGIQQKCSGNQCTKTFDNICQACADKNYPWFEPGVCETDKNYCSAKDKKSCRSSNKSVCAFFRSDDTGTLVQATAKNVRDACTDPGVDFYLKGKCGPSRDDLIYCLPNNRPNACPKNYNPVCGFYATEDGILHKVFPNACNACNDPDTIYHVPGPCVFTCDRNPFVIYDCDGTFVEPVCGTYKKDGKTEQVSLKNACIGCYNVPILIDSYVDGLCPGDEGIRCENDAGGFLIGRIFPVCGVFKEGCQDQSCRQTYSESVVACNDPRVILFLPDMCPEDEGISCEPFRNRKTEIKDDDYISLISYPNVCGYTQTGCQDSSCRQEYLDQYDACGNPTVLFFTEGPCE